MQSTQTQSEPTITKTTNHMADESTASTRTKNTNNNIPNELLQLQQNKNNTSTIKKFKINNNKSKSSLQKNGQNKKILLPTQYQQLQHHYVANLNND